jgi:co-chaperonin GroES (HSP10)
VYVKVQDAEEKTLGGVLLPESAQQRPTSGQVISVGDGALGNGKRMDFTVKPGDEVCAVRITESITNQRPVLERREIVSFLYPSHHIVL